MAESYSVKAQLSAVDKGFTSTLKGAMGAVDSFGSKLTSGFNFGFLSGMGQQAFSTIASGVRNLVGEINSSNAAWKTFTGNMEMLGKSAGEIDSVKKELQAFAEQTVYSSSDMASTFAQLEAVGVKNTTALVKGFGGLAAASDNPQQAMKTLSTQATQMAAKPTVAWADFKLMLEQTPAGIAAVAKHMGMSTAEMVTAVQEGSIATDEFLQAIAEVGTNKDFSKLATEAKTVGQAMDGLKEAVGNKLTPAFDVLSQAGIKAIDSLAGVLSGIDAQGLADKISEGLKTAGEFFKIFKDSFAGVGKSIGSAFNAIKTAMGGVNGAFSKTDAMDRFKSVCDTVAGAIKKVAGFLEEHADTIAKVMPFVTKLAGAFIALKVVNTIAPGLTSFAGSLLKMAGKGIAGLAAKLFGIAGGQKAVGTASAASGPSIMQSAVATLALAAAVALAAVGLALIVQSAIALAAAGWPAVAALVGLVAIIALLAIGAAALGPALTAGAIGFIAFGAAIALVGLGIFLVGAGLVLIASTLPTVAAYGAMAAVAFIQLGAGLALFAVGAALALVPVLGLSAALLVVGAAMVLFGVGALLAATSLMLLSLVLPTLVQYGLQGSVAIMALGGALVIFGAGALVAGAGALVLGAALLVVAAAVVVVAAAFVVLSVGALITALALTIMSVSLQTIATYGLAASVAILALGAAMIVFSIGAAVAGIALTVLSVALLAASVGILLCAAGMAVIAASMLIIGSYALIAATSFQLMAAVLPLVTANALQNAASLAILAGGLVVFGSGAAVAGAGAAVFGAGLLVAAAGGIALALAITLVAVSVTLLGASIMLASVGIQLMSGALMALSAVSMQGTMALLMLGAAMLVFGAGTLVAAAGCLALGAAIMLFGTSAIVASVGILLMAAALKVTESSMSSIAKNATKAKKALDSMKDSVSIVESGLKGLANLAESAMDGVANAFKKAASDARSAGQEVAQNFTSGMQIIIVMAPALAMQAAELVASTLRAGYMSAYTAGEYISQGFAMGMLSQLSIVRNAATKLAAEADKAVRAKAKIASPSKVAAGLGSYFGEGFAIGISDMAKEVWNAAESLVAIPTVATPDLAKSYSGELSADYNYANRVEYIIEVPLNLDKKEFGRAMASTMQEEQDREQRRTNRKYGLA